MRQGQQNRRGRGRNNNNNNNSNQNRRGQNPLTRSFESTGPDVKIRGTPSHIAEKYMTLARDAQSSGDPVLAENYLQHAEHYNRIIMAFREQQIAQGVVVDNPGGSNGGRMRPGGFGEAGMMGDEFGDEEGDDLGMDVQPPMRSHDNQPRHNDGPRYDDRGGRGDGQRPQHYRERQSGNYADRSDRNDRSERQDRGPRPDRGDHRSDRGDRPDRNDRQDRFQRSERHDRQAEGYDRGQPQPQVAQTGGDQASEAPQPRRAERAAVPHHEQPEFLRRPVRRPRREAPTAEEGASAAPTPAIEDTGRD